MTDEASSFSLNTFDILARWQDNPTFDFFIQNQDELIKHVKQPFDEFLRLVSAQPPAELTTQVGTSTWKDAGLEGYFGQFGFFFIHITQIGIHFGFPIISKYSSLLGSNQERFQRNYNNNRNALDKIIPNNTAIYVIHKPEILETSAKQLSDQVVQIFKQLFPLNLVATSDEPMLAIREYFDSQTADEQIKLYRFINENYTLNECAKNTGVAESDLERWLRAIERKKQVVIYGSPGTGKTYIAEQLAKHLISNGDGFTELVQFHPAYSYEDFIQGIRSQVKIAGGLGRFLEFCKKAESCQDICVLIVDDMNRANISQVFGELMYVLEYRDRSIPLAGGSNLRIPANVRIIGTMNTAFSSIAHLDYGLRRRFAFIELRPNYEVLRRYHQKTTAFPVEGLIKTLQRLNNVIANPNYQIGVSFFFIEDLAVHIEDIWQMEIEPYLESYFSEQLNKVDEFRWKKIRSQIYP